MEVPSFQSNISLRQAALAHPPTHEKAAFGRRIGQPFLDRKGVSAADG